LIDEFYINSGLKYGKMPSNGFYKSLFLLLFLSLASAYGDTNILVNPGFENGTEGWAGRSCQIEAVTSAAHSGSGSVKATGRTTNWQGVKQSVFDKMVNGNTYRISGWVRLENVASDPVALSVEQQDGEGTDYHNVASATATDSNWVLLSGDFTLDVNGTLSFLDVYFEGPACVHIGSFNGSGQLELSAKSITTLAIFGK
jgi:hypothetical protein